jgi:hypothetical protein
MEPPIIPGELAEYIQKRLGEENPGRDPSFILVVVEHGSPPRLEGTIPPDECDNVFAFLLEHTGQATVEARVVDTSTTN